jgi:hypothetical protein
VSCFDEIEMQSWLNTVKKQMIVIEEAIEMIVY